METPPSEKHDWLIAAITFVAAVITSVVVFSYEQGQMENRVVSLERQALAQRAEWREARDRIERALEKIVTSREKK
jgi:hypothetical protein